MSFNMKTSYNKTSYNKTSYNKITYDKFSYDKFSYNKIFYNKIPYTKISYAKISYAKIFYTLVFLALTGCILTRADLSLSYALMGLELWYGKMIPALLPFMILSGIMVRMQLTEGFTSVIYPVIRPLYRVSRNVCYAMLMGFLCGFPMGARTVADLYERQMITKREAEYLLAFCNNIGPVYFVSFVLPLLGRKLVFPYLFGMYGVPLLYGLALRYTAFRDLSPAHAVNMPVSTHTHNVPAAHAANVSAAVGHKPWEQPGNLPGHKTISASRLLMEIDDAIHSSVQSILVLGGYMILFNLLNLLPHILFQSPPRLIAPLLEISGGLIMLSRDCPLYSLLALPFGGFSCIAQTYSCIRKTPLSIADYTFHKMLLTALVGLYYLGWRLLYPASFLR